MSWDLLLLYIGVICIPTLVGFIKFSNLSASGRIIVILVLVTLISESIAAYLQYDRRNNVIVYHFYVVISFCLYSLIYFFMLGKMRWKLSILVVSIAFTAFSLVNSLTFEKLDSFPAINIMISNILLVIYSLIYFSHFKDEIELNPLKPLGKNSSFWFNIAVLIYFPIQIFIWGSMNYLAKNHKGSVILIVFGIFVSIAYYLTLGMVIWLDKGSKKSSKSDKYD